MEKELESFTVVIQYAIRDTTTIRANKDLVLQWLRDTRRKIEDNQINEKPSEKK